MLYTTKGRDLKECGLMRVEGPCNTKHVQYSPLVQVVKVVIQLVPVVRVVTQWLQLVCFVHHYTTCATRTSYTT